MVLRNIGVLPQHYIVTTQENSTRISTGVKISNLARYEWRVYSVHALTDTENNINVSGHLWS